MLRILLDSEEAEEILNEVDLPVALKRFLKKLLDFEPKARLSAEEALVVVSNDDLWIGFESKDEKEFANVQDVEKGTSSIIYEEDLLSSYYMD